MEIYKQQRAEDQKHKRNFLFTYKQAEEIYSYQA